MTFKRVDTNQTQIVKALRDMGCTVEHLHAVGKGCPDIVVGFKARNFLLEIKADDKKILTLDQVNWHRLWKGQVNVVTSVDDAKNLIWKLSDEYRSERSN
jgi:Holliday junction resolvase